MQSTHYWASPQFDKWGIAASTAAGGPKGYSGARRLPHGVLEGSQTSLDTPALSAPRWPAVVSESPLARVAGSTCDSLASTTSWEASTHACALIVAIESTHVWQTTRRNAYCAAAAPKFSSVT
jgi:hypothetical protein